MKTTIAEWIVIIILITVGIIIYKKTPMKRSGETDKKKERFGGDVKAIRKIPFNDCERICEGYYQKCLYDFKDADPSWCEERFRNACVSECYYSNFHRI